MIQALRYMMPMAMRSSFVASRWSWIRLPRRSRVRLRSDLFAQSHSFRPPDLNAKNDQLTTPNNVRSAQDGGQRNGHSLQAAYVKSDEEEKAEEVEQEEEEEDTDWLATLESELNDLGIELPKYEPGTYRILCPTCDGGSTAEISLSVTIDGDYQHAMYHCFRATCEWAGIVRSRASERPLPKPVARKTASPTKPKPRLLPLDEECLQFFEKRGISKEVLDRNGIKMELKGEANKKFLAFPYTVDGEIVNLKYRAVHKKEFHQVAGAQKVFYGLDDVKKKETVIIVEGEIDKLSLEMAGYTNVLSVPDGAPGKVKIGQPSPDDKKFSYLESAGSLFDDVTKIVLATDNDGPGAALADELSRRIGTWKCWKVIWPKDFHTFILPREQESVHFKEEEKEDIDRWYRKDANEVLVKDSAEVLVSYIDCAEPFPVKGLHNFMDFFEEIGKRYTMEVMCPSGFSTGWRGLDEYYKVVPGELTVVSGVPNSGKSEWLDALAVQLAKMYGWKIAFASMEKQVCEHARQLIEKHAGKPFYSHSRYAKGVPRMDTEEAMRALEWISGNFPIIQSFDDQLPTIDWILDTAKIAVVRYGIRGLVIDPYNELDHGRPQKMSETEFVSTMLSKIKNFAQRYDVHIWRGEPPNLYDISGSAHFVNKADAGIVIHRNWQKFNDSISGGRGGEPTAVKEEVQHLVRVIIRKMRNKTAGCIGEHTLKYNPVDGTYSDLD